MVSACVYNPHDRCGPNEVMIEADRCTCIDGYVPGPAGCVPCPTNSHDSAGACVCDDGFAAAGDGTCMELPPALGADCDTKSAPCASAEFPECHVTSGTTGYCTSTGCSTSDDCSGGYACHMAGGTSFCRRPPVGLGDPCKTSDDCTGKEAAQCETLQAHSCVVPCTLGGDECFDGSVCCDFSAFGDGLICTPQDKAPAGFTCQ
jgi:hypothetical protein